MMSMKDCAVSRASQNWTLSFSNLSAESEDALITPDAVEKRPKGSRSLVTQTVPIS